MVAEGQHQEWPHDLGNNPDTALAVHEAAAHCPRHGRSVPGVAGCGMEAHPTEERSQVLCDRDRLMGHLSPGEAVQQVAQLWSERVEIDVVEKHRVQLVKSCSGVQCVEHCGQPRQHSLVSEE